MNPCNFPVLDLWFHIKHHRFLHTLKFTGTSHELHVLFSSGGRQGTEQLNIEISREWISCRNATNTANGTTSTVAVPVLFTGQYNFRGWQLQIMIFSHISEPSEKGRPAQWNAPAWPGLYCLRALIRSHKGKAVSVPHRDAEPSLIFGLRTWPIFKHGKIFQSNREGVRKWRQDSSYHPANMSGLGVLPLTVTGPVFHPKS